MITRISQILMNALTMSQKVIRSATNIITILALKRLHIYRERACVVALVHKDFEFCEPLSENISGLDDSEFMNLDGKM